MPQPPMSKEEQAAYDEALKLIEACRRDLSTGLNLSCLGLTRVPPEIGQLTALTRLFLNDNLLTTLPPEIGKLTALTQLFLQNNRLAVLPPELGKLTALLQLYLYNNQLTTLPPDLGKLTALTVLSLYYNQLTTLPQEVGQLTALRELALEGNTLRELPKSLKRLKHLRGLTLHGNDTLGLPTQLLGPTHADSSPENPFADPYEILDYYFSTRGNAGQALREVKLVFVGRGEVGKSSMADALLGRKFVKNRNRTDGISITPWEVRLRDGGATIRIWDFGGQEIMHGTHQFFLTRRSLYVVMVDGRHDRAKQDAEYWLKFVRAFGGSSRVLVVMNRQKAHPFDMDRQHIAVKYGVELGHFYRTDCEDSQSVARLRKAILAQAELILASEELFPRKCWAVKTWLEDMQKRGEDYLSDEAYAAICKTHGVDDEEEQRLLLRRLADLGTVVSFPDEVKLSELSVLNPSWATEGIYRVVANEELRKKRHGLLQPRALRKILPRDRWPKPVHVRYVLALMEKFELCFPVGDTTNSVLVPDLLPDMTPRMGDWDATQCLVFRYEYPVLPHGVLPRFTTRTHELSTGRERWRSGVVLASDGAEALIKADYDESCITIWVRGEHAEARRSLLRVVRSHFSAINHQISGLVLREIVCVPGHPHLCVDYGDLRVMQRSGRETFIAVANGVLHELRIEHLLDEMGLPQSTAANNDRLPLVSKKPSQ